MDISVLPKHHGCEAHIVKQMREVVGGLFEFDESWTEQYHQVGYQFDVKLRNMSESKQAKVRAAESRRINRSETQTQEAVQKLDVHRKGKRMKTLENEADRKLVEKERRKKALQPVK